MRRDIKAKLKRVIASEKIERLETDLKTMKAENKNLKTQLTSMLSRVEDTESKQESLTQKVTKLEEKTK